MYGATGGTIHAMDKTTVYLPVELKTGLRRVARERGVSDAEVIREAIRQVVSSGRPRPGPVCSQGASRSPARRTCTCAGSGSDDRRYECPARLGPKTGPRRGRQGDPRVGRAAGRAAIRHRRAGPPGGDAPRCRGRAGRARRAGRRCLGAAGLRRGRPGRARETRQADQVERCRGPGGRRRERRDVVPADRLRPVRRRSRRWTRRPSLSWWTTPPRADCRCLSRFRRTAPSSQQGWRS